MPRSAGQAPTRARTSVDLPDALGPITPSPAPASSAKVTFWMSGFCWPGAATVSASTDSVCVGRGSAIGWLQVGKRRQRLRKLRIALAGRHEAAPVGDGDVDGGKRPGQHDGGGDDDAGRRLAGHHQIGAKPEHQRLQHHPQRPRQRAGRADDVGDAALVCEKAQALLAPQPAEPVGKAHRPDHLGVAAARLGIGGARDHRFRRPPRRGAPKTLGNQGQKHADDLNVWCCAMAGSLANRASSATINAIMPSPSCGDADSATEGARAPRIRAPERDSCARAGQRSSIVNLLVSTDQHL